MTERKGMEECQRRRDEARRTGVSVGGGDWKMEGEGGRRREGKGVQEGGTEERREGIEGREGAAES